MNYYGKLYGKVGKKYFELQMTTKDVEDLQAEVEAVKLDFYTKLLRKLEKIKAGEFSIDEYMEELRGKISTTNTPK